MSIKLGNGVIRSAFAELFKIVDGEPFLYEDHEVLSLHFSAASVQSSMRKSAPVDLELSYTRTMMAFTLFQPEPQDVIAIGLGGGSLPKYCYHHFTGCNIRAVEINEKVIAFRDEFKLPQDCERFSIIHADGAKYLAGRWQSADVILVDAFTEKGMPDAFKAQRFYEQCYMALRPGGVLVINFWGTELRQGVSMSRLRDAFNNQVMKVRAPDCNNDIVFALKKDGALPWGQLAQQVSRLQSKFGLGFHSALGQMRSSYRQENDVTTD